ncbi:MAG: efflux RND transporter periplasmic adaptor subunit [Acidobacteriota bacterium]
MPDMQHDSNGPGRTETRSEVSSPSSPEIHPDEIDRLLATNPRGRRGLWLAAFGLLALAAVLFARPQDDVRRYGTEAVERRDLTAIVSATGKLEPTDQVDVGSEISGIVADVTVSTNDRVAAGQILARIDTTKLEQQVARSRASLLSAQANLSQALATQAEVAADLERLEEVHRLSDGRVPSKTELDSARAAQLRADAAVELARAGVAESEASVVSGEIDLEKSVIRSPIDGVVLDRRVEPGQTVAASFQAPILFTIGHDLSRMNLTVYVSEADVGRVDAGQPATFTVDAWPEADFEAVVRKVSFGSMTIENVVSYEAELDVANDDLKLRPGMTATASIAVAGRTNVLAVSQAALRFRPPSELPKPAFSLLPRPPNLVREEPETTGPTIYVLREGDAVRLDVETGLSDGRWTEISAPGLDAGDAVVIEILGET